MESLESWQIITVFILQLKIKATNISSLLGRSSSKMHNKVEKCSALAFDPVSAQNSKASKFPK